MKKQIVSTKECRSVLIQSDVARQRIIIPMDTLPDSVSVTVRGSGDVEIEGFGVRVTVSGGHSP